MFQSIAFSGGENLKAEDSPNCQWGVWRAPVQCLNPLTTRSSDTKKWCFLWYPCDHRSVQNLRNQMHTSCGFVPIFKHFWYINKYIQLILLSQQSSMHLTLRCIVRLFALLSQWWVWPNTGPPFETFRFLIDSQNAWVLHGSGLPRCRRCFVVDLKSLNAVYFSFDPCLFQIEIVLQFSGMNFWQGIVVEGRSRMRYGRCRLS